MSEEQRRRSNPPGTRNKRDENFARYIAGFDQHPTITLMQLQEQVIDSLVRQKLMEGGQRGLLQKLKHALQPIVDRCLVALGKQRDQRGVQPRLDLQMRRAAKFTIDEQEGKRCLKVQFDIAEGAAGEAAIADFLRAPDKFLRRYVLEITLPFRH